MLKVIRQALNDVPEQEQPDHLLVERNYQLKSDLSMEERIRIFAERVSEYRATVRIIEASALAETIADACLTNDIRKIVVPSGIPDGWLPADVETLHDGDKLQSQHELDRSDGVITGCNLAIAQTGTLVLDGGGRQGRRALTLLPDYHLCIVFANQITGIVPEAFASLHAGVRDAGSPVTFISGPSATSDIELNRVEGVHGPRRLEVLIIKQD